MTVVALTLRARAASLDDEAAREPCYLRCLLKKSIVRCQASLAAASS